MTEKTTIELLSEFRKITGYSVTVRPFERVIKYFASDDRDAVLLETFRYVETRYEFRVTGHGKRLVAFTTSGAQSVTAWDEEFEPFVIRKTGHVRTPTESRDQITFERDCYRPGSFRTPLDNFARVKAGPTTDAMERYW